MTVFKLAPWRRGNMELSDNVSERCPRRGAVVFAFIVGALLSVFAPPTAAGPEGIQVVNGDVSFSHSGNTTSIAASDMSIINYSSFDIAKPEIIEFIQPNAHASVLNRIDSAMPTNIEGTLRANGSVFFVNPAGVCIGQGAQINVTQLVASGLNISDADFMSGRMNFAGGDGTVTNRGDILAERVYLVGKHVVNTGNISCPAGYAVLAAGENVMLREQGSEVMIEIDSSRAQEPGRLIQSKPGVLNEGSVEAAGGRISLAAGDIFSQAISNVGSLSASLEAGDAGRIKVSASTGQVSNTGSVEAKSDSGRGGRVMIEAAEVINSGTVDVTGSSGGDIAIEARSRIGQLGTIHADGNTGNGGNVELKADDAVALNTNSLTTANAVANGDGGEVIVYSHDTALFHEDAKLEAKGGNESGDGGFIEVSGKRHVEVYGQADASAEVGQPGTFQIDPMNINIQDSAGLLDPGVDGAFTPSGDASTVSDDAIEEWLNGGTNVEIIAAGDDTIQGNITQEENARIDKTAGGDTTIKLIGNKITLDGGIVSESGKLGVRIDADNDVTLTAEIDTNGGRFTSSGTDFDNTEGSITATGGIVKFDHSGALNVGRIDAQDGTVKIAAGVINDGENGPDEDITGGLVKLAATSGAIGPLDVSAPRHLYATTLKDDGDIIISSPGTLEDVSAWATGDVRITITDSGDMNKTHIQTDDGVVNLEAKGKLTINSIVALGEGTEDDQSIELTTETGDGDSDPDIFIEGSCYSNGSIDVKADGSIKVSDTAEAQTSIKLHAGADGSGDLSFEPGATLKVPEIVLRAGNGFDVPDTDTGLRDAKIDGIEHLKLDYSSIAPDVEHSLTIHQDASINDIPSQIELRPDEAGRVDLILQSDDGHITSTTADEWNSIEATALNGIRLEGSDDITTSTLRTRMGNISINSTKGNLIVDGDINAYWRNPRELLPEVAFYFKDAPGGGVELIADSGRIYSYPASMLNTSIRGYSDDLWFKEPDEQVGIELPGGTGRAGIVIISHESLHLGPGAVLTTNRKSHGKDPLISDKDDRDGVNFLSGPPGYDIAGDPVDVSVYLASTGRDVIVDSKVHIEDDGGGVMIVDAKEKVYFGDVFAEDWVRYGFPRLEVISRTTQTLDQAATNKSLHGAQEMLEGKIPNWIMDEVNKQLDPENESGSSLVPTNKEVWSKYLLRGGTLGQVLAFVDFVAGETGGWRTYTDEDLQGRSVFKNLFDMFSTRMHNSIRRVQTWAKEKPKEPLTLLASTPTTRPRLFNKLIRDGNIEVLRLGDILQKDVTVIIEKDPSKFKTLNKDINFVATPLPTRVTIGTRNLLLSVGKIWFWTTDSNSSFEIKTDNDYIIEIIGTASGSVRVEKDKNTNDRVLTVGPIISGQVRVYGPDITPKSIRLGSMAIIKDGKFDDNSKPNLNRAKKDFESIKNGSWPTYVLRLSDINLNDIIMRR